MGRRRQRPLLLKRYARNECRGRACHSRPRLLSSYVYGTLSRRGAAPRGVGPTPISLNSLRWIGAFTEDADTYIDLGELSFEGEGGGLGEPVEHLVKVAEIYRYEDVNDLATHAHKGKILLLAH